MTATDKNMVRRADSERTPHQPAQHVTAGQLETIRHGLRGVASAIVSWTERVDRASRNSATLLRRLDELDQLARTQRAAESADSGGAA